MGENKRKTAVLEGERPRKPSDLGYFAGLYPGLFMNSVAMPVPRHLIKRIAEDSDRYKCFKHKTLENNSSGS